MDNYFDNFTHKIPKLYEHYLSLGKKYSQMAIRKGKKVGEKSSERKKENVLEREKEGDE